MRCELGDQRPMTLGIVGKASLGSAGMEADIEVILADVDTSSMRDSFIHLFRVLGLSSGPQRPGIRSGHEEKREAVTL